MTSPIDNEKLAPSGDRARLPALGAPEPTPAFLARVKENIEILTGQRGAASNWDRAVTFRDLYGQDIELGNGFSLTGAAAPAGMTASAYQSVVQQFERELRNSAAYKELTRRIGSAEDLAIFPEEFRVQLQQELADVARQRQADIQTVEQKIQTTRVSLASRLTEITAALEQTAAGVRQFDGAYADSVRAVATSIKQVVARIDNVGGITVEEKFLAQADINKGLLGQWSVKIQTGTDANPVIAGIALSVEGPTATTTTSSLVFMADRFGFYTQNGTVMPFGIDSNGNVFVNGQLRINDGGTTLDSINAGKLTYIGEFASAPATASYGANSIYKNTSNGNSYILTVNGTAKSWVLWAGEGATGPQGPAGPQGNQGVQGPIGPNGVSYYTWLKYSDNANGAGLYDTPTDSTAYIGIAVNKTVQAESNNPADYVWSRFRGDIGVQGPKGPDGAPTYTWIKYGTSASGAGLSDDPTGKAYIGFAYNKPTAVESTTPSDYSWSLIQGPQGPQGVPGATGPEGQQFFTWIKYSDNPDGSGLYDTPTGTTKYIGIAVNKTSASESNTPSDYVWSKFRGDDGVPGPNGANGQPTYTWIKYGTSVAGAGLSDDPTGRTYIGFAYNKATAVESTVPTDYTWSLIQGPQGLPGDQGATGPRGTTGSTGSQGPRGTVDIAASGYSSWSSTGANSAISGAGYGSPINRDRVTLYGTGFSETRFYDSGSWITMAAYINGNMLVTGTLSAAKVSGGQLSGVTVYLGPSGELQINSSGVLTAIRPSLSIATIGHVVDPSIPCLSVAALPPSSAGAIRVNGGGGAAITITGGNDGILQTGGGTNWFFTVNPSNDNAYAFGNSSFRWNSIYVASGVISTSDERIKTDIVPVDLGLEFVQKLRPVKYKLKVSLNTVVLDPDAVGPFIPGQEPRDIIPTAGTRYHYGLIAQEVRSAMLACGVQDAAFWSLADPDDAESQQALRYEELIPSALRAIQQLADLVAAQQVQIDRLKSALLPS